VPDAINFLKGVSQMAHFAIIAPEAAGHMLSMGPLGKELVGRGHRVTIIGSDTAAPLAEQLELPLHKVNVDDISGSWNFPLWLASHLVGASSYVEMRDWLRWQAKAMLELVPRAIKDLGVDGVLVDHVASAGGTTAERAGVPFVTVCTALPWDEDSSVPPGFTTWANKDGRLARMRNRVGYAVWHWYVRPVLGVINRYRKRWNLPQFRRIDDAWSPLAQISQLCAEVDFSRPRRRDVFHYIGSLTANRKVNTDHGFPWDRLDGRPLVFASLGTVCDGCNAAVLRNILTACAGLDVQLVLALGKWNDEAAAVRDELGKLDGNALVVDFAPQLELLDRAALLITHAGVNTVLEAMSRGLPMVALPRSVDQQGMAARIAHAGVGLVGSFRRSSPEQIRGLVRQILADSAFRQRAERVQEAMLAAGGVVRAADIAEEALLTRGPVRHATQLAGHHLGPCGADHTGTVFARKNSATADLGV
jgi:zeaxanthin glucosyltransferase